MNRKKLGCPPLSKEERYIQYGNPWVMACNEKEGRVTLELNNFKLKIIGPPYYGDWNKREFEEILISEMGYKIIKNSMN